MGRQFFEKCLPGVCTRFFFSPMRAVLHILFVRGAE